MAWIIFEEQGSDYLVALSNRLVDPEHGNTVIGVAKVNSRSHKSPDPPVQSMVVRTRNVVPLNHG